MLILEGPQGALKSALLRMLALRDEWFTDSLPHDLTSKDARAHLAGRWLVEMGEIAQFRRSEIEMVKSYLSCQIDKYRPAYGRSDISVPRQCVFVGTTNATTYLHDPTGNRRFWPVKIGTIQLDKVETVIDQLWAEAVAAYRAGEAWWLSAKLERLAAREQQGRVELDPWHEQIAEFVDSRVTDDTRFTTADILDGWTSRRIAASGSTKCASATSCASSAVNVAASAGPAAAGATSIAAARAANATKAKRCDREK